jgi:hypothetical protein
VTRLSRADQEFVDDALSPESRAEWAASARAVEAWDRAHPVSMEAILSFIDQLREMFGEPPVDRTPWRGDKFLID